MCVYNECPCHVHTLVHDKHLLYLPSGKNKRKKKNINEMFVHEVKTIKKLLCSYPGGVGDIQGEMESKRKESGTIFNKFRTLIINIAVC